MTRFKSPRVAAVEIPARTDVATIAQVGRVESQSSDRGEDVAMPGINRKPSAAAACTVTEKIARRYWLIEQAGVMKRERNRSGTIITVIVKRSVSAAPNVGTTANCVHGPDRVFDRVRRVGWRISDSTSQDRAISADHWMRISEIEARCSRFRVGVVGALNRFRSLRTRRVVGNSHGRCLHRLPAKCERLQRPAISNSRRVNRFARRPRLPVGV